MKKHTSAFPWTDEEDNIIRDVYPDGGWEAVARLTGRVENAIKGRASALKVKLTKKRTLELYQAKAEYMREVRASKKAEVWNGRPERSAVNDALAMRW